MIKKEKKNCNQCKFRHDYRMCPKWMLIHIGDMAGGHGNSEWVWADNSKNVCKHFEKRFKKEVSKSEQTILKQFNKLGDMLYGKNGWSVCIRSFNEPKVVKLPPWEEEWYRENHTQKKSKKKQLNSD